GRPRGVVSGRALRVPRAAPAAARAGGGAGAGDPRAGPRAVGPPALGARRAGLMSAAIELRGISKRFRFVGGRPPTTLKSAVLELVRGRRHRPRERFAALRDIDLTLEAGRTLGVVGANGSGKSTLLKLIAGIYRPDSGTLRVRGRVAPLIELGA